MKSNKRKIEELSKEWQRVTARASIHWIMRDEIIEKMESMIVNNNQIYNKTKNEINKL